MNNKIYNKLFGSLFLAGLCFNVTVAQQAQQLDIYKIQGTCQLGWFGSGQCHNITSNNGDSGKLLYAANGGSVSFSHNYLSGGGGGNHNGYYFYIDAKQNDLILGKNAIDNPTQTGEINFNASGANSFSSIEVKARNIYLGGTINMAHDSTGFTLGITAKGDIKSDATININATTAGVKEAGKLVIKANNFNSNGTINLNGDSTHNGQTLDTKDVTGKVAINHLTATRGNIYANTDFNVTNLKIKTADFNPTTDFYGKDDTTYKIANFEIFGGWGATTKATAKFNSGKTLDITNAKISNWSILDASAIAKVTIDTLQSSYATIKAKDTLEIKNASFSNNETFLESKKNNYW